MPVKLNGATSGSVTIDAPAVAGTNTLTLPAVTDTLVGLAATQTLTNKTIQGGAITSGTVNAGGTNPFPAVSGPTVVDFTNIPSWVKRITVMFSGVSTNGTSNPLIQLGTSSGVTTTGYTTYGVRLGATSVASGANSTVGFAVSGMAATYILTGAITFSGLSGNIWTASGSLASSTSGDGYILTGGISLAATLDRVRITTVNGTDTFDAGSINILYE